MKMASLMRKLALRDQEVERQKSLLEQKAVQIASLTEKNAVLENQLQQIIEDKAFLDQLLLLVQTELHKLDNQQEVPKLSSKCLKQPIAAVKSAKRVKQQKAVKQMAVNSNDVVTKVNKKKKLDDSDDENWIQNLISQNYTDLIKSTLQGNKKPLNLKDLLNEIPCKNKDLKWRNSMTAIINSNKFYCSPEGYYSERPIHYLSNKKQPAHPALSDEFSTKSVKKSVKTRTVKHWNLETSKPATKSTAHPALTESCAEYSSLANTTRGSNRRTLFSLNLQGMVDVLPS